MNDNNSNTEIRHLSVLMEQMLSQNQAVLEMVGDMQAQVKHTPQILDDINTLKEDMKIVKAAVTDTNKELHTLEARVTRIEATN